MGHYLGPCPWIQKISQYSTVGATWLPGKAYYGVGLWNGKFTDTCATPPVRPGKGPTGF